MSEILELQSLDDTSANLLDTSKKLIYSNTIDTTNIQNILLISSKIHDSKLFYDSVNDNTFPIIYSFNSDKTELLDLLRVKFQNGIKRISLAFHDPGSNNRVLFLDNTSFFQDTDLLDNQTTFSEGVNFVLQLITEFNIVNLDFLACNSLQYSNWVNYYTLLTKETNVICGASSDNTGNILYGADWVMENTKEDIMYIYFTDSITSYSNFLAAVTASMAGHATNTLQIRQSGYLIQYSTDTAHTTWTTVDSASYPLNIVNTSVTTPKTVLTVEFITNITMDQNRYFYINIGSSYITINGNNNTFTFWPSDGYVTAYSGLIDNATAFHTITVKNIIASLHSSRIYGAITNNASQGFICRPYFGQNINDISGFDSSLNAIYITNCTLTCLNDIADEMSLAAYYGGNGTTVYNNFKITTDGGGICGAYFGSNAVTFVSDCTNYYPIGNRAGGILGSYAGCHLKNASKNTVLTVTNCRNLYKTQTDRTRFEFYATSTSNVSDYPSHNINGGGIVGPYCARTIGSTTSSNNGVISTPLGSQTYSARAFVYIRRCTNETSFFSGIGGGIVGPYSLADGNTLDISSCINTGKVGNNGGILGSDSAINKSNLFISYCDSSGNMWYNGGGIVGNNVCIDSSAQIISCTNSGNGGLINPNGWYGNPYTQDVGGIAGTGFCMRGSTGVISKCTNNWQTTASASGGIAGPYAGKKASLKISKCVSYARYSTNRYTNSNGGGGIVGDRFGEDSTIGCTIEFCYVILTNYLSYNASGGGLCGAGVGINTSDIGGTKTKITISNCYVYIVSIATVDNYGQLGGMFASSVSQYAGGYPYYNNAFPTLTISNCYVYSNLPTTSAIISESGIADSVILDRYNRTITAATNNVYYASLPNAIFTLTGLTTFPTGPAPWSDSSANKILTAGTVPSSTSYSGTVWARTYTPSVAIASSLNTPYLLKDFLSSPIITDVTASASFAYVYIAGSNFTVMDTVRYLSYTSTLSSDVSYNITNTLLTLTMPYHVQYSMSSVTVVGVYNDTTFLLPTPIVSNFLGVSAVDASNNYRELYITGNKFTPSCTFELRDMSSAIITILSSTYVSGSQFYIQLTSNYYTTFTNYNINSGTVTDSSAGNDTATWQLSTTLYSDYPIITDVAVSGTDYRFIYIYGTNLSGASLKFNNSTITPSLISSVANLITATMSYPTNYTNISDVTITKGSYTIPNRTFTALTSDFPEITSVAFVGTDYNKIKIIGLNLNGSGTAVTFKNSSVILLSGSSTVLTSSTELNTTISPLNTNYDVNIVTVRNAKYSTGVSKTVTLTSLFPEISTIVANNNYNSLYITGYYLTNCTIALFNSVGSTITGIQGTTASTRIDFTTAYYNTLTNYDIRTVTVTDSLTGVTKSLTTSLQSNYLEVTGATVSSSNYKVVYIAGTNFTGTNVGTNVVTFNGSTLSPLSSVATSNTLLTVTMNYPTNYIITAVDVSNNLYRVANKSVATLTSDFPTVTNTDFSGNNYNYLTITGTNFTATDTVTLLNSVSSTILATSTKLFKNASRIDMAIDPSNANYTLSKVRVTNTKYTPGVTYDFSNNSLISLFPTISSVDASNTDYNTVTVTGTNFTPNDSVTLKDSLNNSIPITSQSWVSATKLNVIMKYPTNYAINKTIVTDAVYSYTNSRTATLTSDFPTVTNTDFSGNNYNYVTITGTQFTATDTVTLLNSLSVPILTTSTKIFKNASRIDMAIDPSNANYTLSKVKVTNTKYTPGVTYDFSNNSKISLFPTISSVDASNNDYNTVTVTGANFTSSDSVTLKDASNNSIPITSQSFVSATKLNVIMKYPTNYAITKTIVTDASYSYTNSSTATLTSDFPTVTNTDFSGNNYNYVTITGTNFTATDTVTLLNSLSVPILTTSSQIFKNPSRIDMAIDPSNANYTLSKVKVTNTKYTPGVTYDFSNNSKISLFPTISGVDASNSDFNSLNVAGTNFTLSDSVTLKDASNVSIPITSQSWVSGTKLNVIMKYPTNYTNLKYVTVNDASYAYTTTLTKTPYLTSDFPTVTLVDFSGGNYNYVKITGTNFISTDVVTLIDSVSGTINSSRLTQTGTQVVMAIDASNINYTLAKVNVKNTKYTPALTYDLPISQTSTFPTISNVDASNSDFNSLNVAGTNFTLSDSVTLKDASNVSIPITSQSWVSGTKLNVIMKYPTNYTNLKYVTVNDASYAYTTTLTKTPYLTSDFPTVTLVDFSGGNYNYVKITGTNFISTDVVTLIDSVSGTINSSRLTQTGTQVVMAIDASNINYTLAKVNVKNTKYTPALTYDLPISQTSTFPTISNVDASNSDFNSLNVAGTNFTLSDSVTFMDGSNSAIPITSQSWVSGTKLNVIMKYPTNYVITKTIVTDASYSYTNTYTGTVTSDFPVVSGVRFSDNDNNPRYIYIYGINFTSNYTVKFNGQSNSDITQVITFVDSTKLKVTTTPNSYEIAYIEVIGDIYTSAIYNLDITLYGKFPDITSVITTSNKYVINIIGTNFAITDTINPRGVSGGLALLSDQYSQSFKSKTLIEFTIDSDAVYRIASFEIVDKYANSNTFTLSSHLIQLPITISNIDISGGNYAYINILGSNFSNSTTVSFNRSSATVTPAAVYFIDSSNLAVKMNTVNYVITTYKINNTYYSISDTNDYLTSYFPEITSVSIYGTDYNYVYIDGTNFIVHGTINTSNVSYVKINNIRHTGTVEIISNSLLKVTMVSNVNYIISSVSVIDTYANIITGLCSVTSYFPEITNVSHSENYRTIDITVINFTDVTYAMITAVTFVSAAGNIVTPYSVDTLNNEKTTLTVTMVSPSTVKVNYSISKVNVYIGASMFTYSLETTIESFNTTITSLQVDSTNNEYINIIGNNFGEEFTKIKINYGTTTASEFTFIDVSHMRLRMKSNKYFIYNITISNSDNTINITYNVVTGTDNDNILISPMLETLLSNICFPAKTPITTDQGNISIEQINTNIHTICGKKIVDVTKTVTQETYLVCFEKDALEENIPSQTTFISQNHLILYKEEMIKAKDFIDIFAHVYKVNYTGEVLYNVLMDEHSTMMVNNLICETLNPENGTAKVYNILDTLTQEEQQFVIEKMNELVIKNDVFNVDRNT